MPFMLLGIYWLFMHPAEQSYSWTFLTFDASTWYCLSDFDSRFLHLLIPARAMFISGPCALMTPTGVMVLLKKDKEKEKTKVKK